MLDELKESAVGLRDQALRNAELISERSLQWITNAIERRFNTDNFIVANQTPYKVIHENGLLTVRRYPALKDKSIPIGDDGTTLKVKRKRHRVPVLLVPPLAADPLNFDLFPERSLVKYLLAHGYRVYLADFGSPQKDDAHLGLADYATGMLPEAIAAVREDANEEDLSLLGYCMGGLFCLIYTGWSHDPKIKNIVTIASPIDSFQAGVAGKLWVAMQAPVRLVRRYTGFRIHNLDPEKLRTPGWMNSLAFKLTNPMGTVQGYIDLLMNLWDRKYVTNYQTMSTWFNKMHDYPGGILQDMFVHFGLDNGLARGTMGMGKDESKQAVLAKITCPLLALAGNTDRIVPIEAAKKIMDIVASSDKTFELVPGGHAGVFAGSKAPTTTWKVAAEWLGPRST